MEVKNNELNAKQFLEIYNSVGWEAPTFNQVECALKNSTAVFSLEIEGKPIDMVRIIGDGGMSFYIKDFAIIPEYQNQGLGSILLDEVENYIKTSLPSGWAVSLELISSQQGQAFYEKHGFEPRPNDWDGPGMMKMIQSKNL